MYIIGLYNKLVLTNIFGSSDRITFNHSCNHELTNIHNWLLVQRHKCFKNKIYNVSHATKRFYIFNYQYAT